MSTIKPHSDFAKHVFSKEELAEIQRRYDAEFADPPIDTSGDSCEENLRKAVLKSKEVMARIKTEIINERK